MSSTSLGAVRSRSVGAVVAVVVAVLGCFLFVLQSTPEERSVGWSIVALVLTGVSFYCVLWVREGGLAIFEVGAFYMLAAITYATLPLMTYLLSGMRYTHLSSYRLLEFSPGPEEVSVVAWGQWSLVVSFATAYLLIGRRLSHTLPAKLPEFSLSTGVAAAVVWVGVKSWAVFIEAAVGVNYRTAYASMDSHRASVESAPHWLNQLIGIGVGLDGVATLALLIFLFSRWQRRWSRTAIYLLLLYEVLVYLFSIGARSWLIVPLGAAWLLYFRVVRAPKVWSVSIAIVLFAFVFWALGVMRAAPTFSGKVQRIAQTLDSLEMPDRPKPPLVEEHAKADGPHLGPPLVEERAKGDKSSPEPPLFQERARADGSPPGPELAEERAKGDESSPELPLLQERAKADGPRLGPPLVAERAKGDRPSEDQAFASGEAPRASGFSEKDEFQIWFSSNFEVRKLRDMGLLPLVPWQIYAVDVLLFIPSQLLPFEKVDPVVWFSEFDSARTDSFEYFVYSSVGQGYMGFGVAEIILRGLLLGAMFAWVHSQFIRKSAGFAWNVTYLWFLLLCYTSVRNTTFYVFVLAMQRILVFLVIFELVRRVTELLWRRFRADAAQDTR